MTVKVVFQNICKDYEKLYKDIFIISDLNLRLSDSELDVQEDATAVENSEKFVSKNKASKNSVICRQRRKIKKCRRRRYLKPASNQIHKNDSFVNTLKSFGNVCICSRHNILRKNKYSI